jgi:hypothetical protein
MESGERCKKRLMILCTKIIKWIFHAKFNSISEEGWMKKNKVFFFKYFKLKNSFIV